MLEAEEAIFEVAAGIVAVTVGEGDPTATKTEEVDQGEEATGVVAEKNPIPPTFTIRENCFSFPCALTTLPMGK